MIADVIPSKTPAECAKFIMNKLIPVYGVPEIVTTDRGGEFHDNINEMLCINRIRTTPYNPRSNGEIQRR